MRSKNLVLKAVVQTVLWIGIMGILLFAVAGNWLWWQAWVFIAIFVFGSFGFSAWLVPRDPELLESRLEPLSQKGQPLWDKVFLLVFIAIWFGWLVLMALDAQRWHGAQMPLWLNIAGGLLIVAGFVGTMFVFNANSFAAPQVRLQQERHQTVIDTGPYAVVRHPMYAFAILYLVGIPLLLGSWYGLAAVPFFILGLSPRAVSEERLLARELPGYADYMIRVRYRLIPGVW